jgi:hypothetical protein
VTGSRNLVCPHRLAGGYGKEPPPLIRCQPVAKTHSKTFRPLYSADACSKVGIEQAIVARLIGKPTHGGESKVDRGSRKMPGLQFIAVPQRARLIHAIRVESELQLTIRELRSRGSGASLDVREGSMLAMTLLPGA